MREESKGRVVSWGLCSNSGLEAKRRVWVAGSRQNRGCFLDPVDQLCCWWEVRKKRSRDLLLGFWPR